LTLWQYSYTLYKQERKVNYRQLLESCEMPAVRMFIFSDNVVHRTV
jgi:hypothetical protein